jgi:hypothetical protein
VSTSFAILGIAFAFALMSIPCKNKTEQFGVQMFKTGIREPHGSNLVRETGYPA